MSKQTRTYCYDFRGHQAIADAAGANGSPWVTTDTSAGGAPVFGGIEGGGHRMQFSNDAEVQNLCLSFGDVLAFSADELIRAWAIVKTAASLDAATQLAFGLSSARNDDVDSIGESALFRCIGSNSVVLETDDGTNDNDDVSSGFTLGNAWKRFEINFAERISTMEPPSLSLGRGSNIGFYAANDYGSQRRVASGTRFDMSNYSGGLQPFLQIQKTADANEDFLDVLEFGVEVNLPA